MSSRTNSRLVTAVLVALVMLVASSLLGSPSAAAAVSCSASTPLANRPLLRNGDTGSCVRVLQRLLVSRGYSVGTTGADGQFGQRTELAVRRFQSAFQYLRIDGRSNQATWKALVTGAGTRYSIEKGPNRTNRVTLTFDGCPLTKRAFTTMVAAAKQRGIALVFFPMGSCLQQGRFDVAYARAHGHYVFNHSIDHPDFTTISFAAILKQLGAPGVVTTYGRPPFGAINATVRDAYAAKGMRIWMWSKDTIDWRGPKPQAEVVRFVTTRVTAGESVLMHMSGNAFNPTALGRMQAGLSAKGITICHNRGLTTSASPVTLAC